MTRNELGTWQHRNVHVVGASGAEGFAVLSYLHALGFSRLTAHDVAAGAALRKSFNLSHVSLPKQQREQAFNDFMNLPVTFRLGNDYLSDIGQAELIFVGQNWFAHGKNAPIVQAQRRGIRLVSLIELYFGLSPAPVAGITGTNGKTTTATCLHHILVNSGAAALMSGNDRYHPQILDKLDTLPASGVLVLEISNRQLRAYAGAAKIAVVTNIRPDHIDEHGSFDDYFRTKARLITALQPDGFAVVNSDDPYASRLIDTCAGRPFPFSCISLPETGAGPVADGFGVRMDGKETLLFRPADVLLPGKHNLSNILAAATAAYLLGVDPPDIRSAIQCFRGVRNRLQKVNSIAGVDYYDDLAGTNPDAVCAALDAFSGSVILIVGGDMKGNREAYEPLRARIGSGVKHLVLLDGSVQTCLADIPGVPKQVCADLSEAVQAAARVAEPGDVVLLSPAGAGFYSRFVAPGRGYRRLLRDLARKRKQASVSDNAE